MTMDLLCSPPQIRPRKGEIKLKLYDINRELEQLLEQLEPDPETGEVTPDYDEIIDRIGMLSMKREDILDYLAKLALDARASAQALKAEEKRLKERRERMEGRQDRLIALLDRECGGQKTDLGVATLCYRKNTRIEVSDEKQAAEWLRLTGHDDCYSEREVSFPYNVNKPKQIDLKTIRDRKFKLTIEIIEDEED